MYQSMQYGEQQKIFPTKWDVDPQCDLFDGDSFECEFETAWCPPEGIYYQLREDYPDVDITWFYDEPGMMVAGYLGTQCATY